MNMFTAARAGFSNGHDSSAALKQKGATPSALVNEAALYAKLMNREYTAKGIDRADLAKIAGMYGENIQDIYELGPGQQWMLKEGKRSKSYFFLQVSLMIEMKLDIPEFQKKVDDVCRRRGTLRFAYAYSNLKKPYAVELSDRKAELLFFDYSHLEESEVQKTIEDVSLADYRKGFDLEKDPLLRITVISLKEENRYAFIISQPHINSDGTSICLLIKDLFIDYVFHASVPDCTDDHILQKYSSYLAGIDKNSELQYWKTLLDKLPENISLPGQMDPGDRDYDQAVLFVPMSEQTNAAIDAAQKRYRATAYNILQTAWAVALSRMSRSEDVVFGAITSGRDRQVQGAELVPGGFIRLIPVRVRTDDEMSFSELVREVQQQFLLSNENSHCSIDEIKDVLHREDPIFLHLLNCHNFHDSRADSKGLELPGFKLIGANIYDNLSAPLSIYVLAVDGKQGFGFGYDRNCFTQKTVRAFGAYFNQVLDQVVSSDDSLKLREIVPFDEAVIADQKEAILEEALSVQDALGKIPVLCVPPEELARIAAESEIKTLLHDDVFLDADRMIDTVPFVLKGKVMTWSADYEGWLNPVKINKAGAYLTLAAFSPESSATLRAVVFSRTATVAFIPVSTLQETIRKYPDVAIRLLQESSKEMKTLMKMWINV